MVFAVSFTTPAVVHVNQRNTITSTPGGNTTYPVTATRKSTFEVGESSRREKRTKRPVLHTRTPVRFNLSVDDVDVTKEYDKYVGVSEGTSLKLYLISLKIVSNCLISH